MTGIREQKKAGTRKAIMEAAIELFSTKGFEETSIEDIATRAGIGKATVYTYFAAKTDIFLTYCDDELDVAFAKLEKSEHNDSCLLDQLLVFFMLMFTFVTRNREFGRQLMRALSFPKEVNIKAKEHDQRYFDYLEGIFRIAEKRGEIAPGQDLFILSAHVFSLYFGVLAGWYGGYAETLDEAEDMLRKLFKQVIEGIGR